jgi:hypothetical protein
MSVIERVMTRIETGAPEFSAELLAAFLALWSVEPPQDLVGHWQTYGTSDGFAGPVDSGHFLRLYSLAGVIERFEGYEGTPPEGMVPIGDNGGGEMIVYATGRGYGLMNFINSGPEDLILIDETLEGFLAKSEAGTWFGEVGTAP